MTEPPTSVQIALSTDPAQADPDAVRDALTGLGLTTAHLVAFAALQDLPGGDGTLAPPCHAVLTDPERHDALSRGLLRVSRPWLTTLTETEDVLLWHASFCDEVSRPCAVDQQAQAWVRATPLGWLVRAADFDLDRYHSDQPTVAALWGRVATHRTTASVRLLRLMPLLTDPTLLGAPLARPTEHAW